MRFDPPDDDAYDVRPNAVCEDCGASYGKGDHDPTTLCDRCSDQRDAHTSLLELRLMMAQVQIPPTKRIKDVA
jgi:hypothetical protein